jgi:hypothetical protein
MGDGRSIVMARKKEKVIWKSENKIMSVVVDAHLNRVMLCDTARLKNEPAYLCAMAEVIRPKESFISDPKAIQKWVEKKVVERWKAKDEHIRKIQEQLEEVNEEWNTWEMFAHSLWTTDEFRKKLN